MLAAAMEAWKAGYTGPSFFDCYHVPWLHQTRLTHAAYCRQLEVQGWTLRKACAADRAAYLGECARQVNTGKDREAAAAVRRLLNHKRKKPFAPNVLPGLLQKDGSACTTPAQIAQRWVEHFGELEAGVVTAPQSVLEACETSQLSEWPLPEGLLDMPSESSLARIIATADARKAPGADGIPAEAGRAHPALMAEKLYPLLLKLCLCGAEAVGLKGGALVHLYKGRGPHNHCTSHRGVLLLSTLSKYFHRALRPSISRHFLHNSLPLHLGGKPNVPVSYAAHLIRGYLRWKARTGCTACVLFADISAAFYAAVRQLAVPVDAPSFEVVCRGLQLQPGDLEELRSNMAEPCALASEGASPWLQAIAAQVHTATWMTINGAVNEPMLTHRGTRPGASWADVTFATVLRRVLQRRDDTRTRCVTPMVPWDKSYNIFECGEPCGQVALTDAVWADDISGCFDFPGPQEAAVGIANESGLLADAFAAFGMNINFAPTKTAALMAIRGAGAAQVKAGLYAHASIPVLRENGPAGALPLVSSYRQVGVLHQPDGSIRGELKQRIGDAWTSYRQGRKKIYRNRDVNVSVKFALLRSLVFSRLFYGAGSWPSLRIGEAKMLQAAVLSMLKQISGNRRGADQRLYLCEICAAAGAAAPIIMLQAERLRYLCQLVRTGPDALWALIKQDPSACEPLRSGLRWLCSRVECSQEMGSPDVHWQAWEHLMRARPKAFKAMIRRGVELDVQRQRGLASLCTLHKHLAALQGCVLRQAEPCGLADLTEACPLCKVAFVSRTAWACHASKVHGYRCQATALAHGRTCYSCGKTYANQARLRRHLLAVPACVSQWGKFVPAGDAPTLHLQCPPVMCPGTFCDTYSRRTEQTCDALARGLRALDSSCSNDGELLGFVTSFIAPLPILRQTVTEWKDSINRDDPRYDAAESVSLVLIPSCVADRVQLPKHATPPLLADAPSWKPLLGIPMVLSGTSFTVRVPDPPTLGFVYPFVGEASCAKARKVVDWVAAAASTIGEAVAHCAERPVTILMSECASKVLGPPAKWLEELGFQHDGSTFCSPNKFH